jgi:hypothetical protein
VENRGNVHFAIKTVQIIGKNAGGEVVFTTEAAGWYLLAGASRGYGADVPPERCGKISRIDVEVKADRLSFRGNLVADPSMCAQR